MLTVREVMKALSKEHMDAPVMVVVEKLHYRGNEIRTELTERDPVAASSVKSNLNGEVVIE